MTTLTVTAKGQVTLRKEVLRHLGIGPGDKIEVEMMPGRMLSVRPNKRAGSIEDVFGMLESKDGPVLTLDEIKTATEEAWAGLHEDGKPYRR